MMCALYALTGRMLEKIESSSRFDFSEGRLQRARFNYESDRLLWTAGVFFSIMDVNIADSKKKRKTRGEHWIDLKLLNIL